MTKHTFMDSNARKWQRTSKRNAQKAFEAGEAVLMIPCKLDPASPWGLHTIACKRYGDTFDGIAAFVASLNCSNYAGRYLSYYVNA